jgi:hypothetical protein
MDRRECFERGLREEIALEQTDLLAGEKAIFGQGFDTFSDDVNFEVVAGAADGAEDGLSRAGTFDAADEAHVEFDLLGPKVVEEGQAGVGGAEVVDGQADAAAARLLDERGKVSAILDDVIFGDFEDNAFGGDSCFLGGVQRGEDGARPRLETLSEKIQMKRAIDIEPRGEPDSLGASDLIEQVQPERRDLVEHLPGRLIPRATNECFVADDLARGGVDDRLKGEAEGRVDGKQRFGAHRAPSAMEEICEYITRRAANFVAGKMWGRNSATVSPWSRAGRAGTTPQRGHSQPAKALQPNSEVGHPVDFAITRDGAPRDRSYGQQFRFSRVILRSVSASVVALQSVQSLRTAGRIRSEKLGDLAHEYRRDLQSFHFGVGADFGGKSQSTATIAISAREAQGRYQATGIAVR